MKIEDFGFTPEMGKEYVVNFSVEGELLSTSVYNGSPLPSVSFPDNKKINFTITDKETGTALMATDFISYNGKLYKTIFNLPLKGETNNMNANVHIQDLHYDLTTGSVLVKVQGFSGDKYNLLVSDTTVQHNTMSMPITLEDNTYYSVATELVQGNEFEVVLQDEFGKSIDSKVFTAPISTDWRYTDTVEDGTLKLDEEVPQEEIPMDQTVVDQTNQDNLLTETGTENEVPFYKEPIIMGGIIIAVLLVLVLIMRMMKRKKERQAWGVTDGKKGKSIDPDDEDDLDDIDDDEFDELEEIDELNEVDADPDDIPKAERRK